MSERRTSAALLLVLVAAASGCGYGIPIAAAVVGARDSSGGGGAAPAPLNANTTVAIVEVPRIDLTKDAQPVIVTVTDPESDPVALKLEYRDDGAGVTTSPFLPATIGRVLAGATDGAVVFDGPAFETSLLPSSPTGTVYVLEWRWKDDLGPTPRANVSLRLGVVGTEGLAGGVSFTTENQTIGNEKPAVSNIRVTGSSDVILVACDLSDSTSDPCDLDVTFRVSGEAPRPLIPVEPADFLGRATAPAPGSSEATFAWSSRDPAGVGSRRADVSIEIVARDSGGLASDPATTALFQVNNNRPPLAAVDPPPRAVSGTATIVYRLVDSESDPVTLTARFERLDPPPQSGIASRAGSAGEGTAGLSASPAGEPHTFVWDYAAADLGSNAAARIRFTIEPVEAGSTPGEATLVVGNDAPAAAFATIPPLVTGAAPIGLTLADSTGDLLAIVVEYSTDGGASFLAASGGPVLGLAPGPATFVWQSGLDLPGADGTTVVLRARAIDGFPGGESVPVTASALVDNVGNRPPAASVTTPARTASGPVALAFTLFDPDADAVTATVEVAIDGAAFVAALPAAGSPGTTGLPATASGTAYGFVWDAPAQSGAGGASAVLRVRTNDALSIGASATTSAFFAGNDPPAVAFAAGGAGLAGVQRGLVTIDLTLADFEGDPATVALSYSTNGGASFLPASTAGTTAPQIFWRSDDDLPGVSPTAIVLRLAADDGLPGGAAGAPATASATVRNDAGRPPGVSVGVPPRSTDGLLAVPYALFDPDDPTLDVAVEFSLDGVAFATAQDGPGGDGRDDLGASAAGAPHSYVWDYGSQIGLGARSGVVVRITPTDAVGPGSPGRSAPFSLGNDPPTVTALAILGVPSQRVVRFTIADSSADPCALEPSFRALGAPDFTPIPPERIAAGSVAGIAAPQGGATLDFAWDARGQLGPGVLLDVELRLVPSDPFVTGTAIVSATFTAGDDASGGGGPVATTITGLVPDVGPATGGTIVSIAGDGFVPGQTTVQFGASPSLSVTVDAETRLSAVLPPGPVGVPVEVTVTSPNGSAGGFTFTYFPGVEFVTATSLASEESGTIAVEVRFATDVPTAEDLEVIVFPSSEGSARANLDFDPLPTAPITFAAGTVGTHIRTVLVAIRDDIQREATETIALQLIAGPGELIVGAPDVHRITIADDGDGAIAFFEATPTRVLVTDVASLSFGHDAPVATTVTLDPGAADVTGRGGKDVFPFPIDPGTLDPRAGYRVSIATPTGGDAVEIESVLGDGGVNCWGMTPLPDGGYVTFGDARQGATLGRDRPGATAFPPLSAGTSNGNVWRYVARWQADGSLVWFAAGERAVAGAANMQVRGGAGFADGSVAVSAVLVGDHRFYDAGSIGTGGTLLDPPVNNISDTAILRFDASGKVLWTRVVGSPGSQFERTMAAFADGSIVVGELFSGSVTFGTGEPGETTLSIGSSIGIFLARYAASGQLIFARSISGGSQLLHGLAPLPDGGFLATGGASDGTQFGGGLPPINVPGTNSLVHDPFIARFKADGTPVYARSIGGGSQTDTGLDVAALPDGGSYVTGLYRGTATFGGTTLSSSNQAILTARLDAGGNVVWAKSASENAGGFPLPEGRAVAVLPDGGALVTGIFEDPAVFGAGEPAAVTLVATPPIFGGIRNEIFVAAYRPDGRLSFAVKAGGTQNDDAFAVAALPDGRIRVAGTCESFNLDEAVIFGPGDATETAFSPINNQEGFVATWRPLTYRFAEVRPAGIAWATVPVGTGTSAGRAAAAVGEGESAIAGRFTGAVVFGFGEAGQSALDAAGAQDGFVARYAADGTLVWAAPAGGAGAADEVSGVAADPGGLGLYVAGGYGSGTAAVGRPGVARLALSSAVGQDAFLARLDSAGGALFAVSAGGLGDEVALDVAALPSGGGALVAGALGTADATFGAGTPAAVTLAPAPGAAGTSAFVARYGLTGGLLYARQASGTGAAATGTAVAAYPDGGALFAGRFSGTIEVGFGTPATASATAAGPEDGFVARLDPAGNPIYAVALGTTGEDAVLDVVAFRDGGAVVAGSRDGEAFVARLGPTGQVVWLRTLGGPGSDHAAAVSIRPDGAILVAGTFGTLDANAFFACYLPDGTLSFVRSAGGAGAADAGSGIAALNPDGSALLTGTLDGVGTFGDGEPNVRAVGLPFSPQAFAAKYYPYGE